MAGNLPLLPGVATAAATPRAGLGARAKVLMGLGAAGAGLVALRGMGQAAQNEKQILDLANQRRQDLSTPMPDFSYVKRAYAQFAEKTAADPMPFGAAVSQGAAQGISQGVGATLGDVLVRKPVDVVTGLIKRKFYTEPKQRKIYDQVLSGDENLSASDPAMLQSAHGTLKRYAPSMTMDPNALRAFLRHAMITGGTVDPAMIKQLSEAELTHRRAKGEVK